MIDNIFHVGVRDGIEKTAAAAFGGLSAIAPAASSVLGQTATASRSQIRGLGRATKIKPPAHKPMAVSTPAPAPPRVEPSTITPTQAPVASKQAALKIKKKVRPQAMRVENEPVVHTSVVPRDF